MKQFNVINDALIRFNLQFENFGGRRHDGARNMLGKKSGVVTRISEDQPKEPVAQKVKFSTTDFFSKCD